MASRADIVKLALSQNGYHDGQGYDEPCKFLSYFGINYGIAYCDVFVSWVYSNSGVPLPNMGSQFVTTGSQYCPQSWAYASARGATRNSWLAQPGDQVIFDWTGTGNLGPESHTEIVEKWENGLLYTVGGNSGPSNVDGFKGTGGVHRHVWTCPDGVGNSLIMGVIDTSKLVSFSDTQAVPAAAPEKDWFDMATKDDLKAAIREVLNEGTPNGQKSWADGNRADVALMQTTFNRVNGLSAKLSAMGEAFAKDGADAGVESK
jgi:hypothetical protein